MHTLYFVRHGQTIWNVENKICGATDIALTDLGHQQAIETGKKILEEGIQADEILYSPLVRAAETARHISEVTGIPARMEPAADRTGFWKMGVHAPGRSGFSEGQGAVFKPFRGRRIHAPGGPAYLQPVG